MNQEKNKDNTKKLIVIFAFSVLILIGLVVAGTYAFFSNTVVDRRVDFQTSIKTGKVTEFGLEDGAINGGNLIPGDTLTKSFGLTNRSSGTLNYKLVLKEITNTFVNKQDLIITLTRNGSTLISESDNYVLPNTTTGSVTLKDNLSVNPGETQNFTLTITYRNTNEDQTGDMGKEISATIAFE